VVLADVRSELASLVPSHCAEGPHLAVEWLGMSTPSYTK